MNEACAAPVLRGSWCSFSGLREQQPDGGQQQHLKPNTHAAVEWKSLITAAEEQAQNHTSLCHPYRARVTPSSSFLKGFQRGGRSCPWALLLPSLLYAVLGWPLGGACAPAQLSRLSTDPAASSSQQLLVMPWQTLLCSWQNRLWCLSWDFFLLVCTSSPTQTEALMLVARGLPWPPEGQVPSS